VALAAPQRVVALAVAALGGGGDVDAAVKSCAFDAAEALIARNAEALEGEVKDGAATISEGVVKLIEGGVSSDTTALAMFAVGPKTMSGAMYRVAGARVVDNGYGGILKKRPDKFIFLLLIIFNF
jgi:O-acetyl-ADP-ribose deacetylase (regulator of RNase III)